MIDPLSDKNSPKWLSLGPAWLFLAFIGLAAILLLASTVPAQAQEGQPRPVTDDQVNAIAKQLYCPVCENIPLDVCPTTACQQWRAQIRQMLVEGKTEAEIKEHFVINYGDRVLATPPARGLNWLVYVIPPLAILAGAYILIRAFQTWKQSSPPMASAGPAETATDEYVKRLEEELKRRA